MEITAVPSAYLSAFILAAGPGSMGITYASTGYTQSHEDRSYRNTANQIILLAALKSILQDCSIPGWDGESAMPISARAVEHAKLVINSLPFTVGIPDIIPQSNGKLAFEWYRGPFHQLIISVGPTSNVAYSALLGSKHIMGWKQLSLIGDLIEEMRANYDLIPTTRK